MAYHVSLARLACLSIPLFFPSDSLFVFHVKQRPKRFT